MSDTGPCHRGPQVPGLALPGLVREGAIGETCIKYSVSPAQGHQGGLYNTVPQRPPMLYAVVLRLSAAQGPQCLTQGPATADLKYLAWPCPA